MSSSAEIALVAVLCGATCALAGVFLVLRRLAMIADAISHSVLPGIVAGFVLANGPNVVVGTVLATVSGLLTVWLVEMLTKTRRVTNDTAIGLVFPTMFAAGVYVISKYMANIHIDTDAVLYGEIAFVPFDTITFGGRDYGPSALWLLSGIGLVNVGFIYAFYKELKLSTFDGVLAATLGFAPVGLHYAFMALVAVTTVGAFSAVGAILAVALIVVPPVTASLLTDRLPRMIGLSVAIGSGSGLLGYLLAVPIDVSISGMIAVVLGVVFLFALSFAPRKGLVSQALQRRRQSQGFLVDMLVVHLWTHADTPTASTESSLLHIERELEWPSERVAVVVRRAVAEGLVTSESGRLNLTARGSASGRAIAQR